MDASNPEFKRKLLLGIAVASGALALLMLTSYISGQKEQTRMQLEKMKAALERQAQQKPQQVLLPVLIAQRSIPEGTTITSADVVSKDMPREYITQGVIPGGTNIIGLTALKDIDAGEQILQSKVGRPEKPKMLSALTPPGKRAVSVTVDNSVAGLIQPGDYVDVLAVITPPEGSPLYSISNTKDTKKAEKVVTVPMFQNVLVLMVGRKEKATSAASAGKEDTVTLSLSPQESALIAFVQEQGKIKLVTRSNADMSDTQVEAVNWDALFEHLYPGSRERGLRKPTTVDVYHGLRKETISLSGE